MHLFYTPDVEEVDIYQLSEEESKHAVRVLRLNLGDEVYLTDGNGLLIQAEIIENHPKHCKLKLIKRISHFNKRNYKLHIAVAPTKNTTRFEWFLEKATEIGIDEITPLICEHSERNVVKTERLNKVITAALKQSLKAYHPKLHEPKKFSAVLKEQKEVKMLLAWCQANKEDRIENVVAEQEDLVIFIGPEGGFSKKEIEEAKAAGVHLVSISSSRLRTETAALVACQSIAFINKS